MKPLLWPELDWKQWKDTADTLHMFTQIVGKTRLALTHRQNHWWNVPLYVTARGLSTSAMPVDGGLLDIEFDFLAHELVFRDSSGQRERLLLQPQSVAAFFAEYQMILQRLGVAVELDPMPVELKQPVRFDLDTENKSYDPEAAHRFWKVLSCADTLFKQFSTNFYGKISPVHFFWGSFDLAVTRFNGLPAPPRPGPPDEIQTEAYSHACISAGFWPGNGGYGQAAFYCYAAPVPEGLSEARLSGRGAFDKVMGEFLLPYDDMRTSPNPDQTLLDFLASTYSAAADSAGWDRASLDRKDVIGENAVHTS